jgi:hypothetical protein
VTLLKKKQKKRTRWVRVRRVFKVRNFRTRTSEKSADSDVRKALAKIRPKTTFCFNYFLVKKLSVLANQTLLLEPIVLRLLEHMFCPKTLILLLVPIMTTGMTPAILIIQLTSTILASLLPSLSNRMMWYSIWMDIPYSRVRSSICCRGSVIWLR